MRSCVWGEAQVGVAVVHPVAHQFLVAAELRSQIIVEPDELERVVGGESRLQP